MSAASLTSAPDFLVIGAGITGVALAGQLARHGASVTVIEAVQVCGGSTGRSAGGIRQQFSNPLNVTLAQRTVNLVSQLRDEYAGSFEYHQVGYLFLFASRASVRALQAAIAVQNELGVASSWLTPDEAAGMVPGLYLEGVVGATFCPSDGFVDAEALVLTMAREARSYGARFQSGSVMGIDVDEHSVRAVRLKSGETISAGTVVNCTGAWAGKVAALYGATLPITPWRSQCYQLETTRIACDHPMTIDFDNGKTYFHPSGKTILSGTDSGHQVAPSWNVPFDFAGSDPLVRRLVSRFDYFDDASVVGGWSGVLELTPDENPICGWTHFDNLYTIAGFSGHGLSIAPGLAERAAAELVGARPDVDLSPYRLERLSAGTASDLSAERMSMR
jgi:sarcosine oxidase, subunit beta